MGADKRKPQEDERGTKPPADAGHQGAPREGADPENDPVDSPGPAGNPASDEEALSHRQQEQDPPAED